MHPRRLGPAPHPARPALAMLALLALLLSGCGVTSTVTNFMDSKDSSLRKRVVVAPFTSGVPKLKEHAVALQQAIGQHLSKTGGVVLGDFAALQEESKKVPRDVTNPEDRLISAGRQMGINAVLVGNITDLSVQRALKGIYGMRENRPFLSLEVELRLVDVTTGIVVGQEAFKQQERLDDTVAEAIDGGGEPDAKLLSKLLAEVTQETTAWVAKNISALPWGGTVLAVEGDRVQISVGRDTGLPTGSTLAVYALGERIKAGTGQDLALPGPKVGLIRLTELGARTSWADIIERTDVEKKAKMAKEAEEKRAKMAKEEAAKKEAEAKDGKEAKAKDTKLIMEEVPKAVTFEAGQWVRTR